MGVTALANPIIGGTGTGGSWYEVGTAAAGAGNARLRVTDAARTYAFFPLPAQTGDGGWVPGWWTAGPNAQAGVEAAGVWDAATPPRIVNVRATGNGGPNMVPGLPTGASASIVHVSQLGLTAWYEEIAGFPAGTQYVLVVDIQNVTIDFFRTRFNVQWVPNLDVSLLSDALFNNFAAAVDGGVAGHVTPPPIATALALSGFEGAVQAAASNPRFFAVLEYDVRPEGPQDGVIPTNWRVRGWAANATDLLFGAAGQRHLNDLNPIPGDSTNREIILTPAMFTWEVRTAGGGWVNGDPSTIATVNMSNPLALRLGHLDRASVVTNRTTGMTGTIRDVELNWSATGTHPGVAIRVRTPVYMTRTGNTDVEFDINLRIGGSNVLLGRVAMVVGNQRYYVNNDDAWVSPSRTQYLRAENTVRNIEIYAGEGVTFTRNITGGQSIYVQASLWTDHAADTLFQNHPELVDIIDIHHNNMNAANVRVEIDRGDTYFVYNAQRQLIGTTADPSLPFSTRYYLTTAQINLGGAAGGADNGDDVGDPDSPPAGGDGGGGGSTNVNLNPGTGR